MVHVEGEIVINRPVEEVFDFVADERNEPKYNPHMIRAEQISDGPIGVGTRFRAETTIRRRTVEVVIEFTGYDRPRRLASATHMSTMEIEGMLTFEAVPDGTLMRWAWELHPRGTLKVMAPLVALTGRRQEKATWSGLKLLIEETARAKPGHVPAGGD